MAVPIKMPDFGTNVEEVKLIHWLKQIGEPVARGEGLCEVETDKATVELESIAQGVLLAQVVPAGTDLREGTIIAYVGQAGEQVPTTRGMGVPPMSTTGVSPVSEEYRAGDRTEKGTGTAQKPAEPVPISVKAAPMIRNLAAREGVDLSTVHGSGPGGQITRDDVLRAKAGAPLRAATGRERSEEPLPSGRGSPVLSANQRAVARRVSQSHREIVPINLVGRIDMSAAIAMRQRQESQNQKVSFDAVFVYAVSRVLGQFLQFRRAMIGEDVVAIPGVHVGLAVSVGTELYTPTILDADKKSLVEIDAQIRQLTDKARAGQLTLGEMSGACFTVSNLGMLPVIAFNAIIPPGQAAALAVGAIEQMLVAPPLVAPPLVAPPLVAPPLVAPPLVAPPLVAPPSPLGGGSPASQDTPKQTWGCHITLSVDHRLINGRQGGEFLGAIKQFVEKL